MAERETRYVHGEPIPTVLMHVVADFDCTYLEDEPGLRRGKLVTILSRYHIASSDTQILECYKVTLVQNLISILFRS